MPQSKLAPTDSDVPGVTPACRINPVNSDATSCASEVDALATQIDRMQLKFRPHGMESDLTESHQYADNFSKTGKSLEELESFIDEVIHRLSQAESTNYELALQLRAKSNESHTDGLTGLFNRRWFDKDFGQRCATARQSGCPVAIALVDIDHFKVINDTRGHHVGDAVLRAIAKLLGDHLPSEAVLARVGGEEFAILLSGVNLDDAIETVDQVRRRIGETRLSFEGRLLSVTVSCGFAQLCPQEHPGQLMQRADTALYGAKQAGRNRTFWHDTTHLHLVTSLRDDQVATHESSSDSESTRVIDISQNVSSSSSSYVEPYAVTTPRASRTNWCDGSMLFWFLRQRIAEWKRGGSPFCILAIEIDHRDQIVKSYGSTAMHFMMRAQQFHLEAALSDRDVIARTSSSRIISVLPGSTIEKLGPSLERIRVTMDRFAYPVGTKLLDYSISLGVSEVSQADDATSIVLRAETALAKAQTLGSARFFGAHMGSMYELSPPTVPVTV